MQALGRTYKGVDVRGFIDIQVSAGNKIGEGVDTRIQWLHGKKYRSGCTMAARSGVDRLVKRLELARRLTLVTFEEPAPEPGGQAFRSSPVQIAGR